MYHAQHGKSSKTLTTYLNLPYHLLTYKYKYKHKYKYKYK